MSKYPAPTRKHHQEFCIIEGWVLVRGATGRTVAHHVTYELALDDGRILRTRISRPPNKTTYGRRIWAAILRDQLDVDEATFWACVLDKVVPNRSAAPEVEVSIPAELFHLLVHKAGLPEDRVLGMSKEQAVAAAAEYWMQGGA